MAGIGRFVHVWMYGAGAAGIALLLLDAPGYLVTSVLVAAVLPTLALVLVFVGYSLHEIWRDHRVWLVIGLIIFAALSYIAYNAGVDCESEMNMAGQVGCGFY